ncbi:STAS domain-containing protein [Amycolatopsis solani]|uniref:STAS domain-containing protein n=1 Tax=Amycolatopsis solani TaxID=3028615 RepID=UPI0025B0E573|nr:STAS domain-containing protein [Amycolatopsis sp. MEP2-6]
MPEESSPLLAVRVRSVPEAVVVEAAGELDLASAPVLRARAGAALEERPEALVVDLGGIGFCGSAGLQVIAELVAAATAADVPFALVTDRRAVLRALRITKLDTTFALYPTLSGARAWLRERA